MKFVSKRYVIKIPSEISVLYCEEKKILLIKSKDRQKFLNLQVKILILKEKNLLIVTNKPFSKMSNKWKNLFKSLQGTTVSLIKQALIEVSVITYKKLKLIGVGYKVFEPEMKNNLNFKLLQLKLGYSHSLYYKIPKDVIIQIRQATKLFIFGYNFSKVSQIAAILRSCKVPEPYKGKGILYSNESIILKEGKKV
jgi:large subunit ribosomal protein L6